MENTNYKEAGGSPYKGYKGSSFSRNNSSLHMSDAKKDFTETTKDIYIQDPVYNEDPFLKWKSLIMTYPENELHHAGFSTKCTHVGQQPDPLHGGIRVPIYTSATFIHKTPGNFFSKYEYTRSGNPTITQFNECLASLEYGKYCSIQASGTGAMSTVFGLIKGDQHIICSDIVYGGTTELLDHLSKQYCLEIDYVDQTNLDLVKEKMQKGKTALVWCETPTNPTMKIIDIEKLAQICKENSCQLACDNTFASPYIQNPLLLGADIVVHSCTKYINGHSDIIAGGIIVNDKKLHGRIAEQVSLMGCNISVLDTYMMMRGINTQKVRMQQHCKNAWIIANYLESHDQVEKVNYPGLKSHLQHELAKRQMRAYGGMVSFYIKGGLAGSVKFLESQQYFEQAESLGDVKSLAEMPSYMTHRTIPEEHRRGSGIVDSLIRLSVGIEDPEDLLDDLEQALDEVRKLVECNGDNSENLSQDSNDGNEAEKKNDNKGSA